MTPANSKDTPQISHPHPSGARYIPRLEDGGFWTVGHHLGRSQIVSFAIHGSFAALIALLPLIFQEVMPPPRMPGPVIDISVPQDIGSYFHPTQIPAAQAPHGGGSGGGEDKLTVTKGMLPPFGAIQIVPPHLPSNPNAAMQMTPTLVGDESLKSVLQMQNWGDPSAVLLTNSNGMGPGGGMGDKGGLGIGNRGDGPGYGDGTDGNTGGGPASRGAFAVSEPVCAFCPRPEYSDEARKAKFQGQVMLSVVVLPNGQAGPIEVMSSPGLGLDQKAIDAVRGWRFKPALGRDGKPVAATVTIEVLFQLF